MGREKIIGLPLAGISWPRMATWPLVPERLRHRT